jgi:hypothetical protein
MCKPAGRNGRLFAKRLTDEQAWRVTRAKSEAKYCLAIAIANGGVESMRTLISVSAQEMGELVAWAADEPKLTGRILAAVTFREAVLREFDRLAGSADAGTGGQPSAEKG